jgi:hypothetical protein
MAYDLGHGKQVFIDWQLIEPGYGVRWGGDRPTSWEMPHGLHLAVHPPRIDPQPLVWPDRVWETFINVYCTLFEDEGRFRLYYECHYLREGDEPSDLRAMLAYAESTDGVNWAKPRVGTISFQGSTDNNLVYALGLSLGRGAHGATVFRDPSAPPDQRYKLVHMGDEGGKSCVFGAVSPDGLRWTALKQPLITDYVSDTQTVMRYDERKGRYVGYFRGWEGMEEADWWGRRAIAYAESERFEGWPKPRILVTSDIHDNPDTDIYTNAYTPWPDARNAYLLFPAFYQRALDVTEVHLMTSRDGLHWQRPSREPLIPSGGPGSGWEGGVYAGCGLVSVRKGEWSLPIGPKRHSHNQGLFAESKSASIDRGYLCLATWRQDGFTSLEALTEGQCTTAPLTFTGARLHLSAWTRFGGEVKVELAAVSGETIAEHSFGDCDLISGDLLDHIVSWRGNPDLSAWAGKPLRLRLYLRRARLYALRFVWTTPGGRP